MQVNATNNDLYLDKKIREPNKTLDKDAFLKIMIEQLKNQDPMAPMESDKFLSQMTQFTILEQLTNMNTQFTKAMHMQQLTQGSALIGKQVTVVDADGAHTGLVEKVAVYSGGAKVVLNGIAYGLDQIALVGGDAEPTPPEGEQGDGTEAEAIEQQPVAGGENGDE